MNTRQKLIPYSFNSKKNKNVEGVDLNNRTVAFYTDKNEISALEIEHARKVVDLKSVEINGKLFAFPKITSSKKKLKKSPPIR